jgi:protein tyrosine phosphatase (PTP) superfamily phosphohydrolase (DUF442 family)
MRKTKKHLTYKQPSLGVAGQMPSDIYWIDADPALKLAIMARPRAGDWLEDEIANWERAGVRTIVCLLERDEIEDLGLEREAALCEASGIQYLSFPIPDRCVPDDVETALGFAEKVISKGQPVAIHCRAGIGRSSIIAAAMLICRGVDASEALLAIGKARGLPIPDTDDQRDWVLKLNRL